MRNNIGIIGVLLLIPLVFTCRKEEAPVVETSAITKIVGNSATCGGSISSEGTGQVIVRGVCWSTITNPTILDSKTQDGDGIGNFTSKISALTLSTTYYVRAYATNNSGTSYGSQLSFKTDPILFNSDLEYGSVTDIDGNIYKTIQIGTQTWMAENLRTTKLNDGTNIPNDTTWYISGINGYCWYNNNESKYKSIYGALYSYVVGYAGNLCPQGWHVPSRTEWDILLNYYGGEGFAAGSLKETTTLHWLSPNFGATNESGFTSVPGGVRIYIPREFNSFVGLGTSSEYFCFDGGIAIFRSDSRSISFINGGYYDKPGRSVRCVKD